jgi:hypothetical protein
MVLAGSAVLAAVILGIALWRAGANATTAVPPAPVPSPVAAAPLVPASEPPALDMVISAEEASATPTVRIDVSSDPPGAQVFVRGKHMGMTPVSFDWTDPNAKVGGTMVMVLRLAGYSNQTIRRTVDGRPIKLSATLVPAPPAAATPASPLKTDPAQGRPSTATGNERADEGEDAPEGVAADGPPAPVMVVKPAKPDSPPAPSADEEEEPGAEP